MLEMSIYAGFKIISLLVGLTSLGLLIFTISDVPARWTGNSSVTGMILAIMYLGYQLPKSFLKLVRSYRFSRMPSPIRYGLGSAAIRALALVFGTSALLLLTVALSNLGSDFHAHTARAAIELSLVYLSYQVLTSVRTTLNKMEQRSRLSDFHDS